MKKILSSRLPPLVLLSLSLVIVSCQPAQQKAAALPPKAEEKQLIDTKRGYVPPPPELAGYWHYDFQPVFGLHFTSPNRFNQINVIGNNTMDYNEFKIFHVAEGGLYYAISREVSNFTYYDLDNEYREMTEEEIASAEARYSYIIFDFSGDGHLSPNDIRDELFIYYHICDSDLKKQGIKLSAKDWVAKPETHWERVRPNGYCEYEDVLKGAIRPASGHRSYYPLWEGSFEDFQKHAQRREDARQGAFESIERDEMLMEQGRYDEL